ncbi:nuclear transport factor 2 family protein, partial [uncultured Eudoraea sp.]|uniref:nuclear transport factor 2 family protein n=1 Tax=uncultured Eudoraea sp. TaxID=1035614 RepID=UPI00260F56AB
MKLTKAKQKLLDEAYNTVIQVCLFDRPLEEMTPLLAEDVMNFGAGKNELTKSKAAFLKQIKNQKKLAEGLKMDFAFTPVLRKVMNQGNGAIYTDDIVNTVWVKQIKNELKFRISFIFEYRDGRWLLIHSHTSTPDPQRADNEVWPIEDLKKRTEFLEKSLEEKMAELQDKNRELEVEAALERVRSKTMAMHNSEDVAATVITLYDEVMKLGLDKTLRCGIGILEGTEYMETWSVNYSPSGKVDLKMGMLNMTIHPMLVGLKKAWKSKKKGYTYDFIGKDVLKYYTALNNETEYPFNADLKSLPENVYHNSFFYSSGILFAFAENPFSKAAAKVLNRFAKVFGQTYRRYLDLKKAEEQAKEAQIEAALEKVRASSMAMHKSEELKEVIQVVYDQFIQLNLNIEHTGFIMDYKDNEDMHIWLADKKAVFPEIILPYFDCAHWNSFKKAKKKGNNFFTNLLGFEEKNKFYQDLFEFIPESPKEVKDHYLSYPGLAISTVLLDNVGLYIENFQGVPYSDEDNTILMRFGKVFQQTYTRFLDLQKAEAQAREAQIETALEKVRASSMAMHKSEQLPETAQVLFEQFARLGNLPDRISICIIKEEENLLELWVTDQIGSQLEHKYSGSLEEATTMSKIHKAWKEGKESLVIDLSGQKLKDWVRYIKKDVKLPIDDSNIKGRRVQQAAFFSKGLLLCTTNEPVADETMELLIRFARVFDQTYTRFLDLQKVEAQAREARIEAALERVRAASMAMHKTDELAQVVMVLFQQFSELELDFYQVWINIFFIEEGYSNCWFSPVEGVIDEAYTARVPLAPFEESSIKSWRAGEEFSYLSWRGLKEVDEIAKSLSEMTGHESFIRIQKKKRMDRMEIVDSNHKYGVLAMAKNNDITDNDRTILKRFSKVFEQTYTRFLDLQKAEAQTREAQIEIALERVRSRTMAMHRSEELSDVAYVLFEELKGLGVQLRWCWFSIFDEDLKGMKSWYTDTDGQFNPTPIHQKFKDFKDVKFVFKAWKNNDPICVYEIKGPALVAYVNELGKNPDFRKGPTYRTFKKNISGCLYQTHAIFKQGYLGYSSFNPRRNETLQFIGRFAKSFEQTYTRFLDLKKAEVQAHEATKQASLDRVRGQIASMRSAEDLERITPLVWNELTTLGIPFIRCGVFIINESSKHIQVYLSAPDGHSLGAMQIPFNADQLTANSVTYWRRGEVFKGHWNKEQFNEFMQTMVNLGQIKNIKVYQGAEQPPESLHLHFVPFTQG